MYDLIIIGAGPAGMTAALYAARSNLKVLILEKYIHGGQMQNTADIENYPGFVSISGAELSDNMLDSLEKFNVSINYESVINITNNRQLGVKTIVTDQNVYQSKSIIIATGSHHRKLNVPGEDILSGAGVSYCAICDGAFFAGKNIAVIGGGDSAVEEAMYLSNIVENVTLIHRRASLKAQPALQKKLFEKSNIDIIWDSVVESINGGNIVESVTVKNVTTNKTYDLMVSGVFIYIGLDPATDFLQNLNITNENGWIVVDENLQTSIPGIFAVGDVIEKDLRQITTAVGDGALAAQKVYEYLQG